MESPDERLGTSQGVALPDAHAGSHVLTAVTLLSGEPLRSAVRDYPAELGGLDGLAGALAASPIWGARPRASLVVRGEPHPSLSVVGYLSETARTRLSALRNNLPRALRSLHYVSYARAESDCMALAEALTERLGPEQIARSYFAAIPRGGFIVLGMLAYALDLSASQLEPRPPGTPLILVDDCALTGARFRESIASCADEDITFAVLYAHPDLCTAAEEEARVRACVHARSLVDHAPDVMGDGYDTWRSRWATRTDRFWVGLPDHVCFAWNEPDVALWNASEEVVEPGWRLIPPNHRLHRQEDAEPLPVQMQPQGAYAVFPPAVVYADLGPEVVICNAVDGEGLTLAAAAAEAFRALASARDKVEAASNLAATQNVSSALATAQIERVRQRLFSTGLLRMNTHS